ncbi:MAG: cation diffusion facilitator family transporter [Candidatus Kapabacteria bacterium]|nr:cation diffusion facilitator family transporter [Candidatus Kapabacteria bacterium]
MNFSLQKILSRRSPVSSAYISLIACVFLALLGIALGVVESSLAVRTNGIVAAIDIVNSLVLVAAVNRSIRSPDYIFNYGYGKYEALGLLLSAMMLLVTLGFTMYQAIVDWKQVNTVQSYPILMAFTVVSLIVMMYIARVQTRRAVRFDMPMLNYDADMWKTDSLIEAFVLIGLAAGWILTEMKFKNAARFVDGISAVVLLLIALRVPIKHGREAINQLLDKTLSETIQFDILAVVAENFTNFCEFKTVHSRQSGKDIFVEIDVVMPYDYTFEQAYPIEQQIKAAIKEKFPTAIPRMYVVPCGRECIKDGVCYCPMKQAHS